MSVLFKLISSISISSPAVYRHSLAKSKVSWKLINRTAEPIFQKDKGKGLTPPSITFCCTTIAIKMVWYWLRDRHTQKNETESSEIDPSVRLH